MLTEQLVLVQEFRANVAEYLNTALELGYDRDFSAIKDGWSFITHELRVECCGMLGGKIYSNLELAIKDAPLYLDQAAIICELAVLYSKAIKLENAIRKQLAPPQRILGPGEPRIFPIHLVKLPTEVSESLYGGSAKRALQDLTGIFRREWFAPGIQGKPLTVFDDEQFVELKRVFLPLIPQNFSFGVDLYRTKDDRTDTVALVITAKK